MNVYVKFNKSPIIDDLNKWLYKNKLAVNGVFVWDIGIYNNWIILTTNLRTHKEVEQFINDFNNKTKIFKIVDVLKSSKVRTIDFYYSFFYAYCSKELKNIADTMRPNTILTEQEKEVIKNECNIIPIQYNNMLDFVNVVVENFYEVKKNGELKNENNN